MNRFDLPKNEKYLVAVSGGSDSMALIDMLIKDGYQTAIAHVNYHHRDISDEEEKMVREYAKKNNISIYVFQAYYLLEYGNFENWAREIRYDFFKEICLKHSYNACLVAHQMDDLIETYLIQKKRGYVLKYGLQKERVIKDTKIIRPLLKYTKKELEDYCKNNNITYSYDITNDDTNLLRNNIRKNVINHLSKKQKEELLVEIDNENNKIDKINEILLSIDLNNILISDLEKMENEVFDRLIFKIFYDLEGMILKKKRLEQIRTEIKHYQGNKTIINGEQYLLLKEYNCLKIVKKQQYNYNITITSPTIVENRYIYFDLISCPERFYIKKESYPLTITICNKKDQVKIGKIYKMVNRLFIDAKIPYHQRLYWPKIVDRNGKIIFIPRVSKDENGLFLVKTLDDMI